MATTIVSLYIRFLCWNTISYMLMSISHELISIFCPLISVIKAILSDLTKCI